MSTTVPRRTNMFEEFKEESSLRRKSSGEDLLGYGVYFASYILYNFVFTSNHATTFNTDTSMQEFHRTEVCTGSR